MDWWLPLEVTCLLRLCHILVEDETCLEPAMGGARRAPSEGADIPLFDAIVRSTYSFVLRRLSPRTPYFGSVIGGSGLGQSQ